GCAVSWLRLIAWRSRRLPSVLALLVSAPRPSHFLFARAKEKVTKEKARPTSGPGYAGVPSFRCRSGGTSRRGIPAPSLLARRPCLASPCATPPLGLLTGDGVRVA